LRDDARLSKAAGFAMDSAVGAGDPIHLPSICLVEVACLVEKGRVPVQAMVRLRAAVEERSFGFTIAPLDIGVADMVRQIARN
jgi:predicted nucleic acid-binding protein